MARTYRYREPKRENAPSPYAADHQGVRCKEALRPDNHGGRKNAHGSPTIVRLHHYLGNGQGLGVEQDDKQAAYWYRKAVEQGHTIAKIMLEFMFER